jgi:hypothetical protein
MAAFLILLALLSLAPHLVEGGADPVVVQCSPFPPNNSFVFPPPVVTTVQWNNYSYGMLCGMQSTDPMDATFVAWAGYAFTMSGPLHEATHGLLATTSSGTLASIGPWKQPWPVQEGIDLGEGGFDAGCYSSSERTNYTAIFYTAYCSEDGPCGCIASYPLEVSSRARRSRVRPNLTVTTRVVAPGA